MSLFVIGINHKSAPLAIRERVNFAPETMSEALAEALIGAQLDEVAILSTCNRTEIFAVADNAESTGRRVLDWLGHYHHVAADELRDYLYVHSERDALRHMMQVAAGLDSMILGEPQIFGQMKSAYAVAAHSGSISSELGRIFPQVFATAKRVRTDTAIGENPVSVAYAAVNLTQHIFSDLSQSRALLIGAGETIELVARHLREKGVRDIVVANRTLGRARELAEQFHAEAVLLADIPEQLAKADIVISSTASQLPILGKGAVEHALKLRKHKPIFMLDLAVPRDIEEQVGELDDIYLYTVDDLKEIVDEGRKNRENEARKADVIIAEGVEEFYRQLRALDAVSTVKDLRGKAESLRDLEVEKALRALARGDAPETVLTGLARNLTNKLLHSPSSQLRRASAMGRGEIINWSRELFELDAGPEGDVLSSKDDALDE
ncbi:MAG TPA: glutamyl-tRNA reductase [Spongiibacteraceae bacterium]|nr:glutamyl-tRNA reductase [Spongiibacteraceae bacterium]